MINKLSNLYKRLKINKAKKNGLVIGKGTQILGQPNFGSEPYLVRIGAGTTITSGVKFVTHDGGTRVFRKQSKYSSIKKYGKIKVGDNCFVGINTIIMPNVEVGDNCVVGAGSVLTKSVPPNSVVGGNPARIIMTLEEYMERCAENATPIEISGPQKKDELVKIFWGESN